MENISQLFDDFAIAYKHSLYALENEAVIISKKREEDRSNIKKKYDKERSKSITQSVNKITANLHKIDDIHSQFLDDVDSVIRIAEYLSYGEMYNVKLEKLLFSNPSFPCIIPFIGHGNIMIESNGDECHSLGLQFALQALQQTAAGQLEVTVINPELHPEFSAFSALPRFKMLTKDEEIQTFFQKTTENMIENDSLIQGRYSSLVELRNAAQQPVGSLQLIVVQNLPQRDFSELYTQLLKIAKGAPRAGIGLLILASKNSAHFFKNKNSYLSNFCVFSLLNNEWHPQTHASEDFICKFPITPANTIPDIVADLIEKSKKYSAITVPFNQIETENNFWNENATNHLVFNIGKSGLDTVSVCIGDNEAQLHNILISGAVGKGKSNLLEVMIHSLCWRYSPSELELYLLDFKDGLTFKPYSEKEGKSWLPHAKMLGLESNRDVGLAVLKDLEEERLRRSELFRNSSKGGAQEYEKYRKAHPNDILPRIFLIIDEYQKLFEKSDEISAEASALLENLVRQGRACAIHIVLASQSINGAVGLLGKEERIYAQFPVRIALQNTLTESYALFGIGNDAASKLKIRGEAIINMNYGVIDSNKKITIAFADPQEMKTIRQRFCKICSDKYPLIFTRNDYMYFSDLIPEVKKWRRIAVDSNIIHVPLGVRLSVNRDIVSIPFMNESGKNIAILGSAENLHIEHSLPGQNNMAIGIVQSACIALALQHPHGNARFVLLDGLTQDVFINSNMIRWSNLMERLGFPIEHIPNSEITRWLTNLRNETNESNPDEDIYIICLGMDRYRNFSEMNLCGEAGTDVFQQLLKFGVKGIHFICWWSNLNEYKNHLGFGNEGYFNTKILLRMDADTARDILGPFITWTVRDNRAYTHDNSELETDEVIIPTMPITNRICGIIESEEW